MIVADKQVSLVLTGTGDVLEPEAGVAGIGSGGNYALAAARALIDGDARRRGDRAQGARHRRRHLRLHQPQRHHRVAEIVECPVDRLLPARNRLRTRPLHHRPARRQARRRHRAAQPLAPPAARRQMREEVLPKNILMIGPTGVGKTEISRRLAKLAGAPFLKVEATKFTEVGYVGRDVEQIVRDLVEIGIALIRERKRKDVQAKAELAAEERVLDAWSAPAPARRRARASARGCAPANSTTRRSRSRCSRAAAACRCSKFPACRARRWAPSISATCSASSAAAAPRRGASPCRIRTTS